MTVLRNTGSMNIYLSILLKKYIKNPEIVTTKNSTITTFSKQRYRRIDHQSSVHLK